MPKVIDVTDQKFFNQLINGDTFSADTTNYTPNLVGNVRERMQVQIDFIVYWYATPQGSDDFFITLIAGNDYWMSWPEGNFFDEGFAVGDVIYFDASYSNYTFVDSSTAAWAGTITAISEDGKRIDFTRSAGTVTTGANVNCAIIAYVGTSANEFDAMYFRFGLIENDEPFNILSKVTESEQGWYASEFFSTGGTRTFTEYGITNDWVTGNMEGSVSTTNGVGTFSITHEFTILPSILAGSESDIAALIPPDYFEGSSSLKYAFEVDVRPTLSDNRSITAIYDENQGFTGWFDENLNGLDNEYVVESVAYTDTTTGDPVDGFQRDSRTTVTITISTTGAGFTTGDNIIIYMERFPNSTSEYVDTSTAYEINFMYYQEFNTIDGAAASGGNWYNFSGTISAGELVITASYEHSTAEKLIIEDGDQYLLTVSHQVAGENSGDSTRVMIAADLGSYVLSNYITGLTTMNNFKLLKHNESINVDTGETSLIGWLEDDVCLDFTLALDKSNDALLTTIDFNIVADNGTDYFILDTVSIDLTDFIVDSNDVQQIDLTEERGYPFPANEEFNQIRLYYQYTSGTNDIYRGWCGFKIPWEDWIALQVNSDNLVFFDSAKANNGINRDSENYSGENSYQIKIQTIVNSTGLDAQGRSGIGQDITTSGDITVYDYGESDDGLITDYEITLLDNDSGLEVGQILRNKDTLFRIDWTLSSAAATTTLFGVHRIQKTSDTGQQIEELSSIRTNLEDLLKPLSGQTHLKLTNPSGNDIRTECLIDYKKLQPGVQYNVSGVLQQMTPYKLCFTVIGSASFDPVVVSSETPTWNFGDGSAEVTSLNPTHVYGDTNDYTVCIAMDDFSAMTSMNMVTDGIKGELNIGVLDSLTILRLENNSDMTSLINPVSSAVFTQYYINSCGIIGNLDLSGLSGLGGQVRFHANSSLTSVTNPTSSEVISQYKCNGCSLSTLDLSGLTGLGGQLEFYSNSNLTSITFPTSSQAISLLYAYSCDLTGTIDLSTMTGLGGQVRLYQNTNLTGVTLPASAQTLTTLLAYGCDLGYIDFTVLLATNNGIVIQLHNNNMTAAEVNHILVDLDGTGWINGNIKIDGTNAAPDGTSGGYDGLTAKTNLIASGWTVTTN